nr:DNA (cytosine-5-)-methyltransferase [uncultured Campylobacter sp.]
MKFLELCAGIGGFRQGLDNLGCECVGYSEIDKHAIKLYSHFYNDFNNLGDVTKINADTLPDFDILAGGFPCQAFSVAGKRLGFDDIRGTIFFDFARILKAKKPTFAIFENVKGLLNHDGGKTYGTILKTLDECGYDAQWGVLNTRFHGLPQNRERVYIIANLRKRSATKILFEAGASSSHKVETRDNIIGHYYTASGKTHQGGEVIDSQGVAPCLLATDYKRSRMVKIGAIDGNKSQANRVYSVDGLAPTLSAQSGGLGAKTGLYNVNNSVRRLTPKECFRLQGFKDEMVDLGYKLEISDTQLYKMAGNAVSVPVVEWVAKRVLGWDKLRNLKNEYLF